MQVPRRVGAIASSRRTSNRQIRQRYIPHPFPTSPPTLVTRKRVIRFPLLMFRRHSTISAVGKRGSGIVEGPVPTPDPPFPTAHFPASGASDEGGDFRRAERASIGADAGARGR